MKELVDRVHASMNLLLVATVLVLWALSSDTDVVAVAKQIADGGAKVLQSALIEPTDNASLLFLSRYTGTGLEQTVARVDREGFDADRDALLKSTKVETILGIYEALGPSSTARLQSELERKKQEYEAREGIPVSGRAMMDAVFAGLKKIPDPTELEVRKALGALRDTYARSELPRDATLGELSEKVKAQVDLPVVDLSVPVEKAVYVFSTGSTILLLYIVSSVRAIRFWTERHRGAEEGGDWIFFHPGWLGPVLGIAWLSAPGVTVGLAVIWRITEFAWGTCVSAVLLGLGEATAILALRARRSFLQ